MQIQLFSDSESRGGMCLVVLWYTLVLFPFQWCINKLWGLLGMIRVFQETMWGLLWGTSVSVIPTCWYWSRVSHSRQPFLCLIFIDDFVSFFLNNVCPVYVPCRTNSTYLFPAEQAICKGEFSVLFFTQD